jgi:hypothetical protein
MMNEYPTSDVVMGGKGTSVWPHLMLIQPCSAKDQLYTTDHCDVTQDTSLMLFDDANCGIEGGESCFFAR